MAELVAVGVGWVVVVIALVAGLVALVALGVGVDELVVPIERSQACKPAKSTRPKIQSKSMRFNEKFTS